MRLRFDETLRLVHATGLATHLGALQMEKERRCISAYLENG